MVVLTAQLVAALLKLAFSGLALAIGRRVGEGIQGAAWMLTGVALLLSGVSSVAHSAFAARAFFAGAGAPVYEAFLRWSPVGNHSRSVQAVAMGLLLVVLLTRRREPDRRFWVVAVGALVLSAGVGAALALMEGPFRADRHFPLVALYDLVELLALLTALTVGAARHTLDRVLWLCLGIYALRMALNILWYTALSWAATPGMWRPSTLVIQLVPVLAWGVMCLLAARRLRLAGAGKSVPGLFQEAGPGRVSSFG